jgi:signal transduction histidine kinase
MRSPVRRGLAWIPAFILAASLALALVAAGFASRAAQERDRLRFDAGVQSIVRAVDARLDAYVAMLRAARGLMAGPVDRERFRAFVDDLELQTRYPGIQGIGFSARVPAADLDAFVARMRAELGPGFDVWPRGARDEYHAVVYLEPEDRRNLAAIGYDMATEPVRHRAMERARDTGEPAASGRVTLVQEIEGEVQPGMLIDLPVYEGGDTPPTVAERRARLRGFVYSPFRTWDLLRGIVGEASTDIAFAVYDAGDPEEALLYDSHPRTPSAGDMDQSVRLDVAGRPWRLAFRTLPAFRAASSRWVAPYVLGAGALVSLLLFLVTWALVRERAAALRTTDELRTSEASLREREVELRHVIDAEQAARRDAEAASRAKDEFLATVSHELRTPLQAILGWSTLLREDRDDPALVGRALETIERNARAQMRLITDILDVARIVSGKLRLTPEPVDLRPVVGAAVETVRPTADARGVALEAALDDAGPFAGDPARLQQVVWNLLSNAVKFTPPGGRVAVSLRRRGDAVEIVVRDTGQGIDPAFLPHVFERFRQADGSTSRAHGGLGLGLAIVRHLVELHGGTVRAESEGPGRGATFTVSLPARPRAVAAATPAPGLERVATPSLAGLKVLVVDDEADVREVVARMLSDRGAIVVSVGSAAEGVALAAAERPDVIVGDIGMPGEDGLSMMRRIRALGDAGAAPALALSALARAEDVARALDAGYQAHLAKPVDAARLVREVAALGGREAG